MRLINTNLLNYFYKNGVKPLKDAIANKLDANKLANNLLTTVKGYGLDARQGPVIQGEIDSINSNLSELKDNIQFGKVAVEYGTTTKQITVTFPKKFAEVPAIIAVPTGFSYTSHESYKPAVSIGTVTTTYANINYSYNATAGGSAGIAWIAISS